MKKKFNTRLSVLIATLGMAAVSAFAQAPAPAPPAAASLQLAENAPSRYEVKKGDTLWAIAGRFLKSPWRWNELWRMNKDHVRNPHRIYPGNILVLSSGPDGQPRLNIAAEVPAERPTVRVPLQIRTTPIDIDAIPSIAPSIIDPFLTKPLVVEENGLDRAPKIVGGPDSRVVLAPGYKIYATGLVQSDGGNWQVYRPGAALFSPERAERLGFEAEYLGDAVVDQFGEVSTLVILSSRKEIVVGDRLVAVPKERVINYPPHAPDKTISGRIIGLPTSLIESGRDAVVTLDVGSREGIEIGHVLALYHDPGKVDIGEKKPWYAFASDNKTLQLPHERIGLAFVFRVFEKVSYALVLNTTKQVELGDQVRKP
ncbi:MAG: LysM peptidoglycan-binding domain-containing protein [Betaproteobacteria bacterium]